MRARHIEPLLPTSSSFTSIAPMSASIRMKTKPKTALRRTGCEAKLARGKSRKAQTTWAKTNTSARPLVVRWLYSITVSTLGSRGTISPLQSGQCEPQPAPEPLARTRAPPTITSTLTASTAQPKRRNEVTREASKRWGAYSRAPALTRHDAPRHAGPLVIE
jgi:hypothetical protein